MDYFFILKCVGPVSLLPWNAVRPPCTVFADTWRYEGWPWVTSSTVKFVYDLLEIDRIVREFKQGDTQTRTDTRT